MSGGATTSQQQTGTSDPWAPAQPLLKNILGQLGNQNTGLTPTQSSATNLLNSETGNLAGLSGATNNAVTGMLGGGGAMNYAPTAQAAYGNLQNTLSPYTNANYLNPMSNPYLGQAMSTMNNDITNQISSQFAGAGRSGSPANETALARGLSQGEGQLLANQYNTNVGQQQGAANQLYGAGNSTAGLLSGMNQQGNQNMLAGMGAIPGITAPGQTALQASGAAAQQPYQNIGWLENLGLPIGALGTQTAGQGSTTQNQSQMSNIMGGISGGLGMAGMLFSDERLKENIAEVGTLHDGQPVYSYNYKGHPAPQIGLMAQEVEKVRPDAVAEFGPARIKAVDYDRATQHARALGLLHHLDFAV